MNKQISLKPSDPELSDWSILEKIHNMPKMCWAHYARNQGTFQCFQ